MSRHPKTTRLVDVRTPRPTERPTEVLGRAQADRAAPEGTNIAILRGKFSRIPEHRALASGSLLLTADITVRPAGGPADTVPVVWFDPPERALRFD